MKSALPVPKKTTPVSDKELINTILDLNASIKAVQHDINHYGRLSTGTFQSFIKGIAYGLGALVAVAIVTPFVVWFLGSIAWPPIVAGFVSNVISQIQQQDYRP